MDDMALAQRIWEDRQREARRNRATPWYMVNIGHPAISTLYEDWKKKNGMHWGPPSDLERTLFELSIVKPEVKQLLAQHYETIDRLRRAMQNGTNDF